MDSITHIVLGACMGEAFAGRTVGKKAMLWEIVAQSLPDIDFVASAWLSTIDNLLAHRGFTHSILFAVLISPILAFFAERIHRPHDISYRKWLLFFLLAITMHIFLDAFNNYGVGWFEPFSHYRIAFNTVYVADPFFSIVPAIAAIGLLVIPRKNARRKFWWKVGLGYSILYLSYSAVDKLIVDKKMKLALASQHLSFNRYMTTPAPLQNWLWFVVAANDSGYYSGYVSVFDSRPNQEFRFSPKRDFLKSQFNDRPLLDKLIRFSQQYYTLEAQGDTLLFSDLRFGQIIGWEKPAERFAFYYYLQPAMDNSMVVQRGRFAKWDRAAVLSFIRRIKGN